MEQVHKKWRGCVSSAGGACINGGGCAHKLRVRVNKGKMNSDLKILIIAHRG